MSFNGGLVVVDVSDPGSPQTIYTDSAFNAQGLALTQNGSVLVAYANSGGTPLFRTYDVSDPTNISILNTQNTPNGNQYATLRSQNDILYGPSGGLNSLNATDPANITPLGSNAFGSVNIGGVFAANGTRFYTLNQGTGAYGFEISNPAALTGLTSALPSAATTLHDLALNPAESVLS
jgi:Uncharacterized conserved protein